MSVSTGSSRQSLPSAHATHGSPLTTASNSVVSLINGAGGCAVFWQVASSAFLHGSLMHLAFNMYVLYLYGQIAERMYGRVEYAAIYLLWGGTFLAGNSRPPDPAVVRSLRSGGGGLRRRQRPRLPHGGKVVGEPPHFLPVPAGGLRQPAF